MHPQLILIVAQEHVAELRRTADHDRLVHTATPASSSHAVAAPRHAAAPPVSFVRWLRSHAAATPVSLRPREDQVGDSK